ncbi:MAG: hydantoinase/oxoprolinase family protein [Deltaproteobacteria bacterium]|nr:hydantoinase/oxoprolinase family protein [Deltaproteobacteria bacterium]
MAIDIGGTFTDIVLLNRGNGDIQIRKVLTTPSDPSIGAMQGFRQILREADVGSDEIESLIHSTTVATNAVIERKGPKTALITTSGFRDVLEIGRENRYDIYDLCLELPEPLVERCLRREIYERTDRNGAVQSEPDDAEILRVLESLHRRKVESLAVCLLHSFMNPSNEERIAHLVHKRFGYMFYSLSSRVAGEIREYERTVTTVIDAYVKPIMVRYIESFERALEDAGFQGRLFIMLSNGGIAPAKHTAHDYPVRVLESGPAAGALMTRFIGRLLSNRQDSASITPMNLFSFDMGGTTAKGCLVKEGIPTITHEFEVARIHRFKKGSGYPLKISSIELIEIGAGGGSIARVDDMGLLKVGPSSSGADPGPCCYDLGGVEPTVTDADLVLGYLDPEYFLGGSMLLNVERALKALKRLSTRLGMNPVEMAWGIHELVNENMAAAIKVYSAEKGVDLRGYTLVAFGGAGPVHAYSLARKLRMSRILCPYGAGVASAIGSLVSPPTVDFVNSYISILRALDWDRLNSLFREMEERGREVLRAAGISDNRMTVSRSADMRYVGQGFEISVPIPCGTLSRSSTKEIEKAFWDTYHHFYARHVRDVEIEGISWRVNVSGPEEHIVPLSSGGTALKATKRKKGTRRVYFHDEADYVEADVYHRYALEPGFEAHGPAIVQEKESTVVVGPKARFFIDDYLNLIQLIL